MIKKVFPKRFTLLLSLMMLFTFCSSSLQAFAMCCPGMPCSAITDGISHINIISTSDLQLIGPGIDFSNQSITLQGEDNSMLTAIYNPSNQFFTIQDGQLTVGMIYRVASDTLKIPEMISQIAIPLLYEVKQTSPNSIQFSYNITPDKAEATNPKNFWIRTNGDKLDGIATVDSTTALSSSNALNPKNVSITPIDAKNFKVTFKAKITPGTQYTVIPCFISTPGGTGYTGDNINETSRNVFVGK